MSARLLESVNDLLEAIFDAVDINSDSEEMDFGSKDNTDYLTNVPAVPNNQYNEHTNVANCDKSGSSIKFDPNANANGNDEYNGYNDLDELDYLRSEFASSISTESSVTLSNVTLPSPKLYPQTKSPRMTSSAPVNARLEDQLYGGSISLAASQTSNATSRAHSAPKARYHSATG